MCKFPQQFAFVYYRYITGPNKFFFLALFLRLRLPKLCMVLMFVSFERAYPCLVPTCWFFVCSTIYCLIIFCSIIQKLRIKWTLLFHFSLFLIAITRIVFLDLIPRRFNIHLSKFDQAVPVTETWEYVWCVSLILNLLASYHIFSNNVTILRYSMNGKITSMSKIRWSQLIWEFVNKQRLCCRVYDLLSSPALLLHHVR